jgi:HK97 family phage prohead protease
MEIEYRDFDLTEIRTIAGPKPVIEGHAAVFNQKSHDMGFREIIMPGAFAEAVMHDDVRFLLEHEGLPLARTRSGTLRLAEDQKGLAFRAELDPEDPDVQRLLPKIKRGDVSEMSFGFRIKNRQTDEKLSLEDGEMVRTLLKVSLFDVSAVTAPAYPGTDLQSRSYYAAKMNELRAKIEAGVKPDAEEVKEDLEAVRKARLAFIASRTPPVNPLSFAEIIKSAQKIAKEKSCL